jgi:probable rRNA maturation factor
LDSSQSKSFVHPRLPPEVNELSVLFTSDAEIRKLNHLFRQKDKPTDVLSFSQQEGVHGGSVLGDLVISLDTAKRQAKEYGVTLNQEVLRLIVHGLLHLYGYDHENVSKQRASDMYRAQDALILKFEVMTKSLIVSK